MALTDERVIEVLEEVNVIGATTKQIAQKLHTDPQALRPIINKLRENGKVTKVGRDLWILTKYKDFGEFQGFITPEWYRNEFIKTHGQIFLRYKKGVMASENYEKSIHRWFFCVQGFSAEFVDDMLDRYNVGEDDVVLDPFVGCGTTLVSAKLKGINSVGVELMPIFGFISKVKTEWDIDVEALNHEANAVLRDIQAETEEAEAPFLKETSRQFNQDVLNTLLKLKGRILKVREYRIRRLLLLALTAILIPCSNLKRSPCLGYTKKKVPSDAPIMFFREKVHQIISDLVVVQQKLKNAMSEVIVGDSRLIKYKPGSIDLVITSPPYVNGLDYVINYKIEAAWLNLVRSYEELSRLKAQMVACDNVPRYVTKAFSQKKPSFSDEWLDKIVTRIEEAIKRKGTYRRDDMHLIVRKYFEDLYAVFCNVYDGLRDGGRFIVVIGDSLVAGVYIPTDLILAKMGERVGFSVESIEIARERRSGQRRDFILRESIVVLRKGLGKSKAITLANFLTYS